MRMRNVPERYDIDAYRGDDLVIPLAAANSSGPLDITTHTIIAHIRRNALDEDPPAETFDVVLENPTQGLFLLVLPHARIAALPCDPTPHTDGSKYVWDVQHTIPGGRTKTLYQGTLTLIADVSRT